MHRISVLEELLSTIARLYMHRTDHDVLSSIATIDISDNPFLEVE